MAKTAYFLLGKLLEEMQHIPFDQVFNLMVKTPASMNFAYAPVEGNYYMLKEQENFARLLPDLNEEIFVDAHNAIGAGNIIASTKDLLNWNKYLYKEVPEKLRKVVLKKYFEDEDGDAMHLGLATIQTRLGPLTGFQGGFDSYRSFLGFFPEHNVSIVILSNNSEEFQILMERFVGWLIDS